MSVEGIGWIKHDVSDRVAELRGMVIARHLRLPMEFDDSFLHTDIEDDPVRFRLDKDRIVTYAGLYRSIITAIAEAKEEDYLQEGNEEDSSAVYAATSDGEFGGCEGPSERPIESGTVNCGA